MLFVPPASSQLMIHIDNELRLFVCLNSVAKQVVARRQEQMCTSDAAEPGERLPSLPAPFANRDCASP